ncbi:MAG: ABC transporter permease [Rhodospirillaceae bacterium]|nr:ABC transporter permease [Rhodospirillaceae bacterium]
MLPADPVARLVGLNASQAAYDKAQESLGLDKTITEQFQIFILGNSETAGLVNGSLGVSWVTGSPVNSELLNYLPVTLELIILAFLVATGVGVPIGLLGATSPGGLMDRATMIYSLFAGSQPEFSWGILFIFIFFVYLGIAPGPLGRLSPLTDPPLVVTGAITIDSLLALDFPIFIEALWYLSLPVLTLAFVLSGPIIKMVRENIIHTMQADFILYAKASGLSRKRIAKDALRVSLAPTVTLVGILFSFMIGGAVLVERIFSISGLGQYSIQSILAFDYPAIQGVVLTISSITLIVFILIDIIHALIDPRITL